MRIITLTLCCLLISIVCNILFWDRSYGISMPIFVVIVSSFILWLKRAELPKGKSLVPVGVHLSILVYLSICVVYYRNGLILYATVPSIFAGLGALMFIGQEGYSFSNSLGVIESLVKKLFEGIAAAPEAVSQAVNIALKKIYGTSQMPTSVITRVILGLILSTPFLIIFIWLFVSADPVFKIYLRNVFDLLWQPDFFKRLMVIAFIWVFFCGYLRRTEEKIFIQPYFDKVAPKQNYDGIIIFVLLLMINLVFLLFITVQLEYLFGGEAIIRSTTFTYAEYVHMGFYELLVTVLLVSIIIILTNYHLKEQEGPVRRMVEYAWIGMICQTLVIIASDIKRIHAYEEAYGYTYLRILVALFLLWVAGGLVLFIIKIIQRSSLSWLISSAICLAFVFLVFVSTFSIDRFIARKNIDRYLLKQKELDMEYLSRLSTDTHHEIKRLSMQTHGDIHKSAMIILSRQRETAEANLQHWASWNVSLYEAGR